MMTVNIPRMAGQHATRVTPIAAVTAHAGLAE